jgi:dipeptidase
MQSMLTESHYAKFIQNNRDYLTALYRDYHAFVADTDKEAAELSGKDLTKFLTEANYKIVAHTTAATKQQINNMVMEGINLSQLTFDMDKNL